jgi:acetylornithine deacetylase/succinyl-diaminopimelate desuccinylase-like protein
MGKKETVSELKQSIQRNRAILREMQEILLANVVMAAEIPSPTGGERRLSRFLSDRFTECRLNDIAEDEAGNMAAVLPGRNPHRNILLIAHIDKIWPESEDHTVSVGVGSMKGKGIADNSLGVAVLATLPLLLERLGLEFESNLILLGTSRSFGRGDLGGLRFFLENTDRKIDAALCVEGMDLGRLSYSSLGMARGEVIVENLKESQKVDLATSGVISFLHGLIGRILEMNRSYYPESRILLGTVEAVSGFNVPPTTGKLQFEIRGTDAAKVSGIEETVVSLAEEMQREFEEVDVTVEMIAHRKPGDLGVSHPLVQKAREVLGELEVKPKVEPSISELAALLQAGVPALTLGITRGSNRHSSRESISVAPIFDGLAQLVAMLEFMDREEPFSV